jgi:hypothetical protein
MTHGVASRHATNHTLVCGEAWPMVYGSMVILHWYLMNYLV